MLYGAQTYSRESATSLTAGTLAVIVMNDTDKFEVKKTKILNQII
jgi:hypothetical protein